MRQFRYHKYLPIACLYFFFNVPPALPGSLLITSILSPLLYLWLLLKHRRFVIEPCLIGLLAFLFVGLADRANLKNFIIASLTVIAVYITVYAFAVGISEMRHLDQLIRTIIWLNLGLAAIGLVVRFTSFYSLMWQVPFNVNVVSSNKAVRFSGLTYEPSYYSTLMVPLALYAYWLAMTRRDRSSLGLSIAVLIPLGMSLSFSAIGCMVIAVLLVHLFYGRGLLRIKWIAIGLLVLSVGYLVLPNTSYIRQRMIGVLTGGDSSGNIRTVESFAAGYAMAKHTNIWFGIGLGGTRTSGFAYMPWANANWAAQHPNASLLSSVSQALGETGIVGLGLLFLAQGYLFYRTRPDRDPFRMSLYIWAFIFQFGGSYRGNLAEYVIWILACSSSASLFTEQNAKPPRELPADTALQTV
jgi:hypothetical protein